MTNLMHPDSFSSSKEPEPSSAEIHAQQPPRPVVNWNPGATRAIRTSLRGPPQPPAPTQLTPSIPVDDWPTKTQIAVASAILPMVNPVGAQPAGSELTAPLSEDLQATVSGAAPPFLHASTTTSDDPQTAQDDAFDSGPKSAAELSAMNEGRRLIVCHLPKNCTEQDIQEFFKVYQIEDVYIRNSPRTGHPEGGSWRHALLHARSAADAKQMRTELSGKQMGDRLVRIVISRPPFPKKAGFASSSIHATERILTPESSAASEEGRRLFVGGLPRKVNPKKLRDFFEGYQIGSIEIIFHSRSKPPFSHAFIETLSAKDAAEIIAEYDGKQFRSQGEKLYISRSSKSKSSAIEEGRRLYIENVPFVTTEQHLENFFYGFELEAVKIMSHPQTGRLTGCAFADARTAVEAQQMVSKFSGQTMGDQKLSIEIFRPKNSDDASGHARAASEATIYEKLKSSIPPQEASKVATRDTSEQSKDDVQGKLGTLSFDIRNGKPVVSPHEKASVESNIANSACSSEDEGSVGLNVIDKPEGLQDGELSEAPSNNVRESTTGFRTVPLIGAKRDFGDLSNSDQVEEQEEGEIESDDELGSDEYDDIEADDGGDNEEEEEEEEEAKEEEQEDDDDDKEEEETEDEDDDEASDEETNDENQDEQEESEEGEIAESPASERDLTTAVHSFPQREESFRKPQIQSHRQAESSVATRAISKKEPKILKDLSPDDLRVQIHYFYAGRDLNTVPESDPVHCTICAKPGHMDKHCPSATCPNCGESGNHFSHSCPQNERCSRCRGRHNVSGCPLKLKPDNLKLTCDLCQEDGHDEGDCELRWRSSGPLWKMPLPPLSVARFCYECGGSGHLGNECPDRRPGKPMGSSMWNDIGLPSPIQSIKNIVPGNMPPPRPHATHLRPSGVTEGQWRRANGATPNPAVTAKRRGTATQPISLDESDGDDGEHLLPTRRLQQGRGNTGNKRNLPVMRIAPINQPGTNQRGGASGRSMQTARPRPQPHYSEQYGGRYIERRRSRSPPRTTQPVGREPPRGGGQSYRPRQQR